MRENRTCSLGGGRRPARGRSCAPPPTRQKPAGCRTACGQFPSVLLGAVALTTRSSDRGPMESRGRRQEGFSRAEGLAEGASADPGGLPDHGRLPPRRTVWTHQPITAMQCFDPCQPRGGMRKDWRCRVGPFLLHCYGIGERVGVSLATGQRSEADQTQGSRGIIATRDRAKTHAHRAAPKADR